MVRGCVRFGQYAPDAYDHNGAEASLRIYGSARGYQLHQLQFGFPKRCPFSFYRGAKRLSQRSEISEQPKLRPSPWIFASLSRSWIGLSRRVWHVLYAG